MKQDTLRRRLEEKSRGQGNLQERMKQLSEKGGADKSSLEQRLKKFASKNPNRNGEDIKSRLQALSARDDGDKFKITPKNNTNNPAEPQGQVIVTTPMNLEEQTGNAEDNPPPSSRKNATTQNNTSGENDNVSPPTTPTPPSSRKNATTQNNTSGENDNVSLPTTPTPPSSSKKDDDMEFIKKKLETQELLIKDLSNQQKRNLIPAQTGVVLNYTKDKDVDKKSAAYKINMDKYLSSRPNFDESKINRYMKEFEDFKIKMAARALGSSTAGEEGMLNPLRTQIAKIRSRIAQTNNETEMKYGYKEILRVVRKSADLFDKKNRQFLIDAGFLQKVQILLDYEGHLKQQNGGAPPVSIKAPTNSPKSVLKYQRYTDAVDAYNVEVIQRFYDELERELTKNFNLDPKTQDKEDLERDRDALLDELSTKKEKLYALYYNKVSIMDLVNQTFMAVYMLKGFRVFFAWFSTYMASKILQERYVSQVFANNEDPPDLRLFVGYYFGLELMFIAALMLFLSLVRYLFDKQGDFIINGILIRKFLVDYVISTIFILLLSLILASVMMSKKYFRYKTDGLRAIRSLQSLTFYITCIISAIPFFMIG
jgi:hypothetical protein